MTSTTSPKTKQLPAIVYALAGLLAALVIMIGAPMLFVWGEDVKMEHRRSVAAEKYEACFDDCQKKGVVTHCNAYCRR